jgi:hypothetical protein
MIKMTPTTKIPFMSLVDYGVTAIKNGGSIETAMIFIERDPMFSYSGYSLAEIKEEIEFWAGKAK